MELTDELKQAIAFHADQCPDQEVCGVVLKDNSTVWSANLAEDSSNGFCLDENCTDLVLSKIAIAVYHSHPSESHPRIMQFSGRDEQGQWKYTDIYYSQHCKIPYILYHTIEKSWDLYDPDALYPFPLELDRRPSDPMNIEFYLRWQWHWGRSDCYSLMRSYFRGMVGIQLPEVERSPNPDEFKDPGWDKYRLGLVQNGFIDLNEGDKLQLHDVVLMKVQGENFHHCGIIVDAERSWMLHHLMFPRLSERIVYGGYWLDLTHSVWRHETLWG